MRSFYNTHGKHCHYRSFQASCPKCGGNVFYWECTHGCKVFFEYPIYGKLIRHMCKSVSTKNERNKYQVIVKNPKGLLVKASPSCPICGKLFKKENDLKNHLKQLKKGDHLHKNYFDSIILFEDASRENIRTIGDKQKFGTINIKNEK